MAVVAAPSNPRTAVVNAKKLLIAVVPMKGAKSTSGRSDYRSVSLVVALSSDEPVSTSPENVQT
jgi:hypothetical protein